MDQNKEEIDKFYAVQFVIGRMKNRRSHSANQ